MTREEAIKVMEYPIRKWLMDTSYDGVYEAWEMAIAALREQEERSKGCHNCYGNDMAIDAVDNPCWNCKAGHSEWIEKPTTNANDEPSQIEKLAARYERNMHKPWKKIKTNADRIRSLSDEELAEVLVYPTYEYTVDYDYDENPIGDYTSCWATSDGSIFWHRENAVEFELELLQQPVKEDA